MTLDSLSNHLGFAFQVLVFASIFLVFWQIDVAKKLDDLRNNETDRLAFRMRRDAMFAKLMALCWTVIYSAVREWQPWPPIVLFLAAFDWYIIANIMVMRDDIKRIKGTAGNSSPPPMAQTARWP